MDKIKLTLENGEVLKLDKFITVREVIKQIDNKDLIALRINGSIVDADYELDKDAYVNFITVNDRVGRKIYTKGLKYVYLLAVKELYGNKATVEIKHSLDKYLYTELNMKNGINENIVEEIKNKMKEIIKSDIPFRNVSV